MSMLQHSTRAWGSPSRYIQGRYELENMKTHTEVYGRRAFFLIDVFFFADYIQFVMPRREHASAAGICHLSTEGWRQIRDGCR